jgi:hypothetical protein
VRPGDYELRTVWLGYRPDDRTIIVPREGLDVAIVLARLPFQLDTMRVVARRTGIIGTAVQQADFRALGGVDVEILGTRHRLRTKADGLFNFDVREGSYVLLGRRSGFASRMIPVPVPSEEAVEVALAMDTAETKAEQIVNNRIQDLQMRIRRASSMGTAIVGRHELLGVARRQDLETALRYAPSALMEGLIWERVECVFVDGLPQPGMLTRDYLAEDVAMVEVYNRDGGSNARDMQMFRGTGSECGVGRIEESFETGRGAFRTYRLAKPGTVKFVWIWLKK